MHGPRSLVTIAVPSYNQGQYLEQTLTSIFDQNLPVEVYVADAGSSDNSIAIIKRFESRLLGWRSHPDQGQAAAINEGIAQGTAPYVCWINSDDYLLPGQLSLLINTLNAHPEAPAAYGLAWNYHQEKHQFKPIWVEAFAENRLAIRCIICQPATLIRRTAWEAVDGLDPTLLLALDYDLWWRLFRQFGPLIFIEEYIAVNREHKNTKTRRNRAAHYQEAIKTVKNHYGRIPLKWRISTPYSVWFRTWFG